MTTMTQMNGAAQVVQASPSWPPMTASTGAGVRPRATLPAAGVGRVACPGELSAAARRVADRLQAGERVTAADLRRTLGARRAAEVITALERAWVAVLVPGGDGGREGRTPHLVWMPVGRAPAEADLAAYWARLRGWSGTLGALAVRLDLTLPDALAVMRALVARGAASGGPAGATFACRVP